jgi:membrane protease YdiL (CAAX protease family)
VTWPAWFWAGSAPGGLAAPGALRTFVLYVGIFAPALVAIALTALGKGREGVGALLRRLFQGNVALRWYVFAIGYYATIKLGVALIHRALTGTWPVFSTEAWYLMIAATAFSTMVGVQAGEEIGWRGYALPRLEARFGLARASLLLGVIWAVWHLPLFFIAGADKTGQSFPLYLGQATAISVAIAWLWKRTGGSLLLTMLMHAAVNNTNFIPSVLPGATNPFTLVASLPAWLTSALLWVGAAYFLARMSRPRPLPLAAPVDRAVPA